MHCPTPTPPPHAVSPPKVRDALAATTGVVYDSVLVNLYPDGKAGMRFHVDPLYGRWTPRQAVVSLGDTRTFVFREISDYNVRCVRGGRRRGRCRQAKGANWQGRCFGWDSREVLPPLQTCTWHACVAQQQQQAVETACPLCLGPHPYPTPILVPHVCTHPRWTYSVRNGDCVLMFGDCQDRLQHCIKVERRGEDAGPRMSLVFKERLKGPDGRYLAD